MIYTILCQKYTKEDEGEIPPGTYRIQLEGLRVNEQGITISEENYETRKENGQVFFLYSIG